MCYSNSECLQGVCHRSLLQNLSSDALMPVKNFCGSLNQNGTRKHHYWRWNMGSLSRAGKEENDQGMVTSLLTETEEISHNAICIESDADLISIFFTFLGGGGGMNEVLC